MHREKLDTTRPTAFENPEDRSAELRTIDDIGSVKEHLVVIRGKRGYCYTCDDEMKVVAGKCIRQYRAEYERSRR